jgi:pyruvate carboxylase
MKSEMREFRVRGVKKKIKLIMNVMEKKKFISGKMEK